MGRPGCSAAGSVPRANQEGPRGHAAGRSASCWGTTWPRRSARGSAPWFWNERVPWGEAGRGWSSHSADARGGRPSSFASEPPGASASGDSPAQGGPASGAGEGEGGAEKPASQGGRRESRVRAVPRDGRQHPCPHQQHLPAQLRGRGERAPAQAHQSRHRPGARLLQDR